MSDSRGQSEKTQATDKGGLHKYRTELPNLILDLDLDVYEGWLYTHLKRIAGDKGNCFATNKILSAKTHMSIWKVKKVKKALEEKGLIKISVRRNEDMSFSTTLIEIEDIWPQNFEHFKDKGGSVSETPGSVCETTGVGCKTHPKEEPLKKNQLRKKESKPKKAERSSLASEEAHIPPKFSLEIEEIVDLLLNSILSIRPEFKVQDRDIENWSIEADRMLRLDKREMTEVRQVLAWLPTDEFWRKNILSMKKLRKQYDKLCVGRDNENIKSNLTINKKNSYDLIKFLRLNKSKLVDSILIDNNNFIDNHFNLFLSLEMEAEQFKASLSEAYGVDFT